MRLDAQMFVGTEGHYENIFADITTCNHLKFYFTKSLTDFFCSFQYLWDLQTVFLLKIYQAGGK